MLRALGVSTPEHASTMPEVPTLQEQGVPDFDVASWYGIAAPAATPRPIVERMAAEIIAALEDPAIAARLREYGAEPWLLGPAEYDAFMRAEVARWAPVVRRSGASVE
jgi:tripartite-type tricarboxylate transporter receptor subunit TctC